MKIVISDGCNNNCSFCVVPYTRGKERYKSLYNIIIESYKTNIVCFLGQNVSSYYFNNSFIPKNIFFKDLIKIFNYKFFNIIMIEFITSNVKDFNKKTIIDIFSCEKISSLVHLPLQSGSNKILKKMNRKYNLIDYINCIKNIKIISKRFLFSTDIIINFFEKKKDFLKTIYILKSFLFDRIFFFNISFMKNTSIFHKRYIKKKNTKLKFLFIKRILEINIIINSINLLGKKIKCFLKKNIKKNIYIFYGLNKRKILIYSKKRILKNHIYYSRIINFYKAILCGNVYKNN
ncbi:radical SAM protein [Candidatus Vidania fulgoroideorum]